MVRARNALHAKMACPTNNQDNCTKTVIQHFSYSVSDESVRRCANVHKVFRFLQMQVFLWNQLKTCKQVTYRYSEQRGSACPAWAPVHQMFSHRIRRIQVLTVLTPSPTYAAPNLQTWSSSQRVESAFITALELCRPSLQLVTILNSCPHHVRC